ncbi:MAG TPA: prolipoprotein diacylglyceryl transferase [Patescibacteria group bacterium]|nr:prolipoprotein diacylglyceryl transferase [Patescibacteria group bacterium]
MLADLPSRIDPLIFSIGSVAISWYAVLWVVAFGVGYALLRLRVRRGEGGYVGAHVDDLFLAIFIGAFVGGRIGYVLFYNLAYYASHPIAIFSPYDFAAHAWTGLYGMSFHGGLIGVAIALWIFARSKKENVWSIADFLVPVVPLGYFFGRIGNFFNGDLYGRVTSVSWGMIFPQDPERLVRHPSQLYEAFFEGIALFCILWPLRNRKIFPGFLSLLYLFLYGIVRLCIEFFRAPDPQLGFVFFSLTMGQILSLAMIIISLIVAAFQWKKHHVRT